MVKCGGVGVGVGNGGNGLETCVLMGPTQVRCTTWPEAFVDLMQHCWSHEAAERPDMVSVNDELHMEFDQFYGGLQAVQHPVEESL